MISDFIQKQRRDKIESNWYKQSKVFKEKTMKSLIEHEKILQQEIKDKDLFLKNQLILEKQISQEKLIQLNAEKEKEEILQTLNNIPLLKQELESTIEDNKKLKKEKELQEEKIKQLQVELRQETQLHLKFEKEKNLTEQSFNNIKTELQKLQKEKKVQEEKIKQLQVELHQETQLHLKFEKEKNLTEQSLNNIKTELQKLQKEKEVQEEKIKQLQFELHQETQLHLKFEKEKNLIEQNLNNIKTELQKLQKEKIELQEKTEKLEMELNKEKNIHQDKIEQLTNRIYRLKSELEKNIISEECLSVNNIPTIYIIYQYLYKNNVNVTGFGDFIRGCFYILQFSYTYKINFDFNICNHPIKKYLEYFSCKPDIDENISKEIVFFKHENHEYYHVNRKIMYKYYDIDEKLFKFIKYTKQYNNNKFLYLTNHPNEKRITQNNKKRIRELIKPTKYITDIVETAMVNLRLIKNNFIIIHLRMYDDSFYGNNSTIKNRHVNIIIEYINTIKQNSKDTIFLITSDNIIKSLIINKIPDIKTIFHDITHIGEISITNDNNLINTLKEFYIMSYSNYIYSFSVYQHGSGFSKWCAMAYNIPYVCMLLE